MNAYDGFVDSLSSYQEEVSDTEESKISGTRCADALKVGVCLYTLRK
jgi:hypothetical protein